MGNKSANSNVQPVTGAHEYSNLSASGVVSSLPGNLIGVFCASSSSGTLKLWDNTSAGAPILVNTFSLVGGSWYPIPIRFKTGLYATIGGTADITVAYS